MKQYFFLFFSFICLTMSGQINNVSDTLKNWEIKKTEITIDTVYLSGGLAFLQHHSFNYHRNYSEEGIIEWGNIDLKTLKPTGFWLYEIVSNKQHEYYCSGNVEIGHKVKKWNYHCGVQKGCYAKYKKTKGKTKLKKSKVTLVE